jgi:hypothetical protein
MLVLVEATIAKTGKNRFLILRDENGAEYFGPFAGFRKPVITEDGVQYAKPAGKVGKFSVGQEVLIISVSKPTQTDLDEANAAGKPAPLPSAEEWVLFKDFHILFK